MALKIICFRKNIPLFAKVIGNKSSSLDQNLTILAIILLNFITSSEVLIKSFLLESRQN